MENQNQNHETVNSVNPEPKETDGREKKLASVLLILYAVSILLAGFQILFNKKQEAKTARTLSIQKLRAGQPAIAVVPIYGVITVAETGGFRPQSSDRIVRRLKSLSEREDVKAVVLRINSPGGSVGAVQEIADEVERLKKSGKKVVASMGDVAASGGYYVASAADAIFADAGTLTGSIGVIFQIGNLQELFKKVGVKIETIKSGEHKDIGSLYRPLSERERQLLQGMINDVYEQFVDAVTQGRKMERGKVLKVADGRIFTGAQAKSEGLVDELGNLEAAIARASQLAGIEGKPRVFYEEDPWEKIFSLLEQGMILNIWSPFGGSSAGRQEPFSKFGVRFAYLWEYAL